MPERETQPDQSRLSQVDQSLLKLLEAGRDAARASLQDAASNYYWEQREEANLTSLDRFLADEAVGMRETAQECADYLNKRLAGRGREITQLLARRALRNNPELPARTAKRQARRQYSQAKLMMSPTFDRDCLGDLGLRRQWRNLPEIELPDSELDPNEGTHVAQSYRLRFTDLPDVPSVEKRWMMLEQLTVEHVCRDPHRLDANTYVTPLYNLRWTQIADKRITNLDEMAAGPKLYGVNGAEVSDTDRFFVLGLINETTRELQRTRKAGRYR